MSVSKSQITLLLAVAALAVVAGLCRPAIEILRVWQLGSLLLAAVVAVAGLAPWAAVWIGRRTSTSGPVTVLLATAVSGLAAAVVSPHAGALWGLLASVVLVYPDSTTARLLLGMLRGIVVFGVGAVGVALSRRVYIDGGPYRWASLLLVFVTVLAQFCLLRAAALRRTVTRFLDAKRNAPGNSSHPELTDQSRTSSGQRSSSSEETPRSRLAALATSGAGVVVLLAIPLSWKVGWHGEMRRRVGVIAEKGGSVGFDRSEILTALWQSAKQGDWRLQAVHALPYDPQRWRGVDTVRDLLWGPPALSVTLRNASPQHIRTLHRLYGIQELTLVGHGIDDATLSELPLLDEVTDLTIQNTSVTGAFLRQPAQRLCNISSVRIEQSPFTDFGLKQLDQRLDLGQPPNLSNLSLFGTQVTPLGIETLSNRAEWPRLSTDISFDQHVPFLIKVLHGHSDNQGRRWAVQLVARLDPEIAAPLLIDVLDDPDDSPSGVRRQAVGALTRIGWSRTASEELFQTVERALGRLAAEDSNEAPWQKNSIRSNLTNIRVQREVRAAAPDEQLPMLIELFLHSDSAVRHWAVCEVGGMDPVVATPRLIKALGDPAFSGVQNDVQGALRDIGSSRRTSEDVFLSIERALEQRLLVLRETYQEVPGTSNDVQRLERCLSAMRNRRAKYE